MSDQDQVRKKATFNLQAGYALLVRRYPFLAGALYRMEPVWTDQCLTAAIDWSWRLYYGPWLAKLTPRQAESIVYHELLHLVRNHERREALFKSPESDLFINVVEDLEINDDLQDEGFDLNLPSPLKEGQSFRAWTPDLLGVPRGLTWEEYHDLLRPKAKEIERMAGPRIEVHLHGSGTGRPVPFEAPGPEGDEKTPKGVSESEAEVIRQGLAEAIAKHPGTVPGHLKRWAEERLKPSVDWRKALRQAVRSGLGLASGAVDYRYGRPHRRQSAFPVILPRLVRPQARVLVCIDTSGSIGDRELSQFLAEVDGVTRALGVPVDVASGDMGLMTFQKGVIEPGQVTVEGGGGTDMGRLLEEAWRKSRAQLAVVLTDGYTPWPQRNPTGARVIVATTDQPGPAWAQTVKVDLGGGRP